MSGEGGKGSGFFKILKKNFFRAEKNKFLANQFFAPVAFICKVRPTRGRELVIKCAAQTAREARLYAKELTTAKFVSSICAKSL